MNTKSWLAGLLTGATACAVLIVACSDDSPPDVDAAVCDCPAAEPPLSGRIVAVRSNGNPIAAGSSGGAAAACPVGATVLGGACEVMNDDSNILLSESRFDRTGGAQYVCKWSALNATVANTGFAEAICLLPPP